MRVIALPHRQSEMGATPRGTGLGSNLLPVKAAAMKSDKIDEDDMDDLEAQAVSWILDLEAAFKERPLTPKGARVWNEFQGWLRAHPEHSRAYRDALRTWRALDCLAPHSPESVLQKRLRRVRATRRLGLIRWVVVATFSAVVLLCAAALVRGCT